MNEPDAARVSLDQVGYERDYVHFVWFSEALTVSDHYSAKALHEGSNQFRRQLWWTQTQVQEAEEADLLLLVDREDTDGMTGLLLVLRQQQGVEPFVIVGVIEAMLLKEDENGPQRQNLYI